MMMVVVVIMKVKHKRSDPKQKRGTTGIKSATPPRPTNRHPHTHTNDTHAHVPSTMSLRPICSLWSHRSNTVTDEVRSCCSASFNAFMIVYDTTVALGSPFAMLNLLCPAQLMPTQEQSKPATPLQNATNV